VFLAGLAVFATLYAPQAALPELTRAFAVSPGAATLAISVSTASLAVGLLVLGPLSDRRGRTPVLHASLAAAALLGVLLALTPVWELLLVLRALQGFALAGLPAVAVASLREELHPAVSSRAIGLYVSGTAIGGLIGRLLTGFLTELGGWRAALGGTALLAVGCAVAVRLLLPPSRRFTGTFRLESPPYSLTPGLASLVFLSYLLGSASSLTAGWLADRAGRRLVVPLAVVVMAAGIAVTLAAPLWCTVVGICLLTIGFFAAHGVASGWVAVRAQLGGRAVGQAASLYSFWYYVGSSVGGTLAGRAWEASGWPGVVVLAGACTVGALLLTLLLGRTRSLQAT
jgi:YNFM family putative membrane transporter